ncbi:uncharacterized protein LODBEIA_P16860 [Lodderomyces beijingensis]|uniref:Rho-GAP domain-containing protein n=1 Tax=Lodderomyces beijingensis TaxID=1775926 RepID=A0ABP0ZJ47_9ASCO
MSFADNFWTQDYQQGFQTLFSQLHEGVCENNDFIQLIRKRMESELLYGHSLQAIAKESKPTSKRHFNDDYVSTIKNAYTELSENFTRQGQVHLNIAGNIQLMVLTPFEKWCGEHEQRVDYSTVTVHDEYKKLRSAQQQVDKLQKKYFNKCRILEEFKTRYSEQELQEELSDLVFQRKLSRQNESDDEAKAKEREKFEFNHAVLTFGQTESLLKAMLTGIAQSSHKVAILGTYQNVSSGSAITQWALDHVPELNKNLENAEKFGQDLIKNEFIRVVGSMGKSFINSSQFYYQWKPKAFEIAQIQPTSSEETTEKGFSTSFGQFNFDDMKEAIGVTSVDYNDKSQYPKLIHEVESLDGQYFDKVASLDGVRCKFEELVFDHLTFMQKCELDRLRAIKKVTFDFIAAFSNTMEKNLRFVAQELKLLEETINPKNDLKFLIENYATGNFRPQVTLYDNYYHSNMRQTFGVDLTVKSRLDKKVVPLLIQCILSHLDHIYPDLKDDEERINIWTQPIHLSNVHKLRLELNGLDDPRKINDYLSRADPIAITNVLKLYLMELPDSVIPSSFYDIIRLLYNNYQEDSQKESRINGLQNVLAETPKPNLATLDALLTHLKRLVQIIGSKDKLAAKNLQNALCVEFGKLVLRPRPSTDLFPDTNQRQYLHDKHQVSIMQDLFRHKDAIFNELKRNTTRVKTNGKHSSSSASSSRNVSREGSSKIRKPSNDTVDPPPLVMSMDKPRSSEKSAPASTSGETLAAKSKSRLESRLKKAVTIKNREQRSALPDPSSSAPVEEKEEEQEEETGAEEKEQEKEKEEGAEVRVPSTPSTPPKAPPPPPPPKTPSPLKRSVSPHKKSLNSMLIGDIVQQS